MGKPIRLVRLSQPLAREDPELTSVLVRYTESIRGVDFTFKTLLLTLCLLLMFLVVYVSSARSGIPPWIAGAFGGVCALVASQFLLGRAAQKHASRLIESVLRIGRCPACGYDLRSAHNSSSEMCICPECSATWKSSHIGHASVPASDLPVRPDMPGDVPPLAGGIAKFLARNPTIIDDRNRCFPRVDMAFSGVESELGSARAVTLRAFARKVTRKERIAGAVIALLFISVFAWRALTLATTGTATAQDALLCLAMLMGGLFYGVFLFKLWKGRTRFATPAITHIAKEHGVCPSCGGSMASTDVEPDGCRICPKCHAAWKMPNSSYASSRTTTSV